METNVPTAARELLALERKWRSGGLDEAEGARWSELVVAVLGDARSRHGRRSFRLPAQLEASVRMGTGEFACDLLEVSRLGLTFGGAIFRHIIHEHALHLVGVVVDGAPSSFDLKCQIERVDPARQPAPVVGVSILPGNDPGALRRFFDVLYYPIYLRYLEELAEGVRAPSMPPPPG